MSPRTPRATMGSSLPGRVGRMAECRLWVARGQDTSGITERGRARSVVGRPRGGSSMTAITDLETPAVTVHLDVMEDNIRRVQAHLDRHRIANRPHIKTHKIPAIGKMQMAAGAVGITCQKLGEVEVFADAGVADDVLLTYNILGPAKTERLMALARRVTRLAVVLVNDVVARELSEAARRAQHDLPFLIECDTGFRRTGVQSPDEALALARQATARP